MENIKAGYIPVGQVVKKNYKTYKISKFIKKNKLMLTISIGIFVILAIYIELINSFINLLIKL